MKHFKKKRWFLPLVLLPVLVILFFSWPLPNELATLSSHQPLRLLDRDGRLLYEVRTSDLGSKSFLSFDEIPPVFIQTLLAVEDRRFYDHFGVSFRATLRAFFQNRSAGTIVSGGSTITQQLVRNQLQPKKRDYRYKLKEALLALKLETRLDKKQILEAYLNTVYFGRQAYGIQAASWTIFNKNPDELSLAETAFLVGLIQSPSAYDPFAHFDRAKARQKVVLKAMEDSGTFAPEILEGLEAEPLKLGSGKVEINAPHFVFWVLDTFASALKNQTEVRTTLDLDLQQETERIIQVQLEKLKEKNVTSAAVVVLNAHTGEILAMVGSADYFDAAHDGAVNVAVSPRQPGSALKPFTYALAFKRGYTPATTVADIETQFFTQEGNPYIPRNYDYGYHGLVRYREALANSYNIAVVRVLERVGVQTLLDFLRRAGITTLNQTPEHYGLALTLGSGEVTLLELTQAYGMLARQGKTLNLQALLNQPAPEGDLILDPKIAWLISDILSDDEARLSEFGENGPLSFAFPVAAKTGTTRNSRDNWTLGYTPDIVVGVWVGNADNSPMKGTSGVTGAGPIFHEVMLAATRHLPPRDFPRPSGLIQKEICRLSGLLPTDFCPLTLSEWFVEGTEPRQKDTIFKRLFIDTRNGLKATETCSAEFTTEKVFAVFPPELRPWARENGWVEPPTRYSPFCLPQDQPAQADTWISIIKPHANDHFLLDPLIPDSNEKILFEATASDGIETIEWLVNDQVVGTAKAPGFKLEWPPSPGRFVITAKAGTTESKVTISILKN